MSSWLELQQWYTTYTLDAFPWAEWISLVQDTLPLPVYDLSKILDSSAVYDMAIHAVHWPASDNSVHVRVPLELEKALRAIDIVLPAQQMYMARALYAHCGKYTAGMLQIKDPPVNHMQHIALMPVAYTIALANATFTLLPSTQLTYWLEQTLRYGRTCTLCLRNKVQKHYARPGRRRKKYSPAAEARCIADHVQHDADTALADIHALAPAHVPLLGCTVTHTTTSYVSLVLFVKRPVLCDE